MKNNKTDTAMNPELKSLEDTELDSAVGGFLASAAMSSEDPQMYGKCPQCAGSLTKKGENFYCKNCKALFDKDKNMIYDVG